MPNSIKRLQTKGVKRNQPLTRRQLRKENIPREKSQRVIQFQKLCHRHFAREEGEATRVYGNLETLPPAMKAPSVKPKERVFKRRTKFENMLKAINPSAPVSRIPLLQRRRSKPRRLSPININEVRLNTLLVKRLAKAQKANAKQFRQRLERFRAERRSSPLAVC